MHAAGGCASRVWSPPVGVCEDVREAVGDDRSLYAEDVCRYVRAADDMACEDFEGGDGDGR